MYRAAFVSLGLFLAVGRAEGQRLVVLDRSLKDVEAWAREDTNDADRQYFLALRHWKENHWRQTDSLLKLTIQLEPHYAEAFLALWLLPYARRPSLGQEALRNRVPDSWKGAVDSANQFYKRAFRTSPMVTFNALELVYGVEEPQRINYTPSQWLEYERWGAWWFDLGLGRYRSAYDRLNRLALREFDGDKHPDRVPGVILMYRAIAAAHILYVDSAIVDFRELLNRSIKKTQGNDATVQVPLADNDYRFMLATLHHVAGHTDSAVALYQESVEHDLGLSMAHTNLANIYDKAGRAEDAMIERRRAAEIDSDDPTALFDLGMSLFKWGMLNQADEPLQHAIAVNPRYAPPYYLLARVDEDLGRPAAAREHYAKFLATAPLRMEDWRESAQQRLDSLPK